MAGRPVINVDGTLIGEYVDQGFNKSEIANFLNVSRPTLYKAIEEHGLSEDVSYDVLSPDEVDRYVKEAKAHLPFMGERMVIGYLKSKGYAIILFAFLFILLHENGTFHR